MSTSPAQSPSPADPPGRIRLATWHRGHVVAPSSKRPRGWLSLGGLSGAAYILPDRSCMGNHSDTLGVTGPGPAITCIKICIYIYIYRVAFTQNVTGKTKIPRTRETGQQVPLQGVSCADTPCPNKTHVKRLTAKDVLDHGPNGLDGAPRAAGASNPLGKPWPKATEVQRPQNSCGDLTLASLQPNSKPTGSESSALYQKDN